jgi:hypothetical protein
MSNELVQRLRALNLLTTKLKKEDWRKAAALALQEAADTLERLEGKSDPTGTSKKPKNIEPH